MKKTWTKQDCEILINVFLAGQKVKTIAAYFGVTKQAIYMKVHRLKEELSLQSEKDKIFLMTLELNNWHRTKTANYLNMSTRGVRMKIARLKRFGVNIPMNPNARNYNETI